MKRKVEGLALFASAIPGDGSPGRGTGRDRIGQGLEMKVMWKTKDIHNFF